MTVQQRVREGGIRESKIYVCACVHAYQIFQVMLCVWRGWKKKVKIN